MDFGKRLPRTWPSLSHPQRRRRRLERSARNRSRHSLPGLRVARVLDAVAASRGAYSKVIAVDNGPELTSKALDGWARLRGVELRNWRKDDNERGPRSALGNLTPKGFVECRRAR